MGWSPKENTVLMLIYSIKQNFLLPESVQNACTVQQENYNFEAIKPFYDVDCIQLALQCHWNIGYTVSSFIVISACFLVRTTHCKKMNRPLEFVKHWTIDNVSWFSIGLREVAKPKFNSYLGSFPPVMKRNHRMHFWIVAALFCVRKTAPTSKLERKDKNFGLIVLHFQTQKSYLR